MDKNIRQKYKSKSPEYIVGKKLAGNGYFSRNPLWSFRFCDFDSEDYGFAQANSLRDVLLRLKSFEQQTCGDICNATGKRNTLHHYIPIRQLITEAQKRLREINLHNCELLDDELFSLHISGRGRLWGILDNNGIFYVVWYDPEHHIYPVEKSHT
jgi:hypothetical protein